MSDASVPPPSSETIGDAPLLQRSATSPVTVAPATLSLRAVDPDATMPAAAPLPPGIADTLGRYRLHGEIGRGGMGAVLRGRDPNLGRELALKVLLHHHRHRPEVLQRFLEEAQIGGQLQHPGIVPVYEVGDAAGTPYFTMKLVRGHTLAALLAQRPQVVDDRPRFLMVFEQVCQTLAYAHARGVIHRDLKPANIMVGAFGEVQVMDWGLARVLGTSDAPGPAAGQVEGTVETVRNVAGASESRAGSVVGTPAYMAPEQARGEIDRLDERCDVFGLGAILCEILTGRPPFAGSTVAQVLAQAAGADLAGAFARLDGCGADGELVQLARACLAPERDGRPRHAGAVAARVTEYRANVQERLRASELERAAAEARAEEARAKAKAERRARRLTLGLAASVLLTLGLGGGTVLWLRQQRLKHQAADARRDAALNRAVEKDLREAEGFSRQEQWGPALAVLERAKGRLGANGDEGLHQRVRQLQHEVALRRQDNDTLARLEAARLQASDGDEELDWGGADRLYRAALARYGLDADPLDAPAAAARIRSSSIREELVVALDDWARGLRSLRSPQATLISEVAGQADSSAWRQRLRTAIGKRDWRAVQELAGSPEKAAQAPTTLVLLAEALQIARLPVQARLTLQEGQRRHPGDFWLNFRLAMACSHAKPQRRGESVRYYTAAVALRPQSAIAYNNLGVNLGAQGGWAEAAAAYRDALRLQPNYARAYFNLGVALRKQAKWPEALAAFNESLRCKPEQPLTLCQVGLTLRTQGKFAESLAILRRGDELGRKKPGWRQPSAQWVRSAERLVELDSRLPAFLKGDLKPANAGEQAELGRLCRWKKQFVAAVSFFAAAFAARPELANDWRTVHRYNAAVAGAAAASGQGLDAVKADKRERTRLRRQALSWLRADLMVWTKQADANKAGDQDQVRDQMLFWQMELNLAGVRDKEALAKLPAAERGDWEKLWQDVAALRRRTR